MNHYKAFYRDKTIIVEAETTLAAQKLAATELKAKKSYEVAVVLVQQEEKQIVHVPDF